MNHHSSSDQFDNLLNEPVENQSTAESYWSSQSEEVFLQNLFANTLLTDGFNVNDNLDLSYNSNLPVVTHEPILTNHQGLETSNNIFQSIGKNINTLGAGTFVEEGTKNLEVPDLGIDSITDFVLNLDTSYNLGEQLSYNLNLNAIEPTNFLLKETSGSQQQIDPLASPLQDLVLNNTENNLFSLESNNTNVLDPSIQILASKNDDSLFKKPIPISSSNYLNSYIDSIGNSGQNISTADSNKIQKNTFELFPKTKNLNDNDSVIKNGPNKKAEKTLNDLNFGGSPKEVHGQQIEKNNVQNEYLKKEAASNENTDLLVNISPLSSSPMTSSKLANACYSTSPSSTNKLFTLKRSRKRSKLISNTSPPAMSKHNNLNSSSSVNHEIPQKITLNKQAKLTGTKKKNNKKEKKEKVNVKQSHQQNIRTESIFSSNLEPLSKKFAVDTASKSKGEVELHIKELSLLDLHSSEDDSTDRIVNRNSMNDKLKKFMSPMINEESTNLVRIISPLSQQTLTPTINDGKREKPDDIWKSINQANSISCSSISSMNDGEISSNAENENNEKRFLKKSSIDSDSGVSAKSSCDSLNKKKLKESKSTSSFTGTGSISLTLNSQNKRKKQNNNDQYCSYKSSNGTNKSSISIVSTSLPSSSIGNVPVDKDNNLTNKNAKLLVDGNMTSVKSLTLDIDTLQNMKNLDLNQDKSNKNFKTPEKQPTSYNSINSPNSIQLSTSEKQSKYIKGANTLDKPDHLEEKQPSIPQTSTKQSNDELNVNLNDKTSRQALWNLLKSNSTIDEMLEHFGSALHDKISFWDLVKMKIKHSKKAELKTVYEITEEYSTLYSNMSTLLEGFVKEHSQEGTSSRSRSSSRNYRKQ